MRRTIPNRPQVKAEKSRKKMHAAYRISGHETFPFRYTWLPKAVRGLTKNPRLFSDEDEAMVALGVGKNMVRSIRFWAQATGVSKNAGKTGTHNLTDLGIALLGEGGLDAFLEDVRTLWLIHWNLSTDRQYPLLAWDYLLNRWQEPELVPSQALKVLAKEVVRHEETFSPATLEHHLSTFLHTYVPTRGRKGEVQEDNLDCPLVELALLQKVGEQELDRTSGRRESVYVFRREEKRDITPELFAYCLNDFWNMNHENEGTLSFRDVAHGHGSPGQIFKLPEDDIRERLEALDRQTTGYFVYSESTTVPQVRRKGNLPSITMLKEVYAMETQSGR
jgi:hypothetical protein